MSEPTKEQMERARAYQVDDLVSRIWHICVDTTFSWNDLCDDEMCGVDAAVLAQDACAKIKALIQPVVDSAEKEARAKAFDEARKIVINSGGDEKVVFTCIETEIREAERAMKAAQPGPGERG